MKQSLSKQSFAVVGGGLVGRLLAWRLLTQGHSITLVEQGSLSSPTAAAHTAAAMISPLSEVVVSERSIYDMGIHSLAVWPEWLAELASITGANVQYSAKGSIVVAHPKDQSELEQFQQELNHHLGAQNPARWINSQELRQTEPDLAGHFNSALFLPGEAYLDNRHLLSQLLQAISKLGGELVEHCTVDFLPEPCSSNSKLSFDQFDCIVDCRGMGTNQSDNNIRGVRGEVLWVETDEVRIERPIRLMHPRYKIYLVPKPDNKYIIGATEIESQDRSPVSVQSMLELCSALYTLNPAFAEARIHELDANLRPAYWDNLPRLTDQQINLSGKNVKRVSINGLYRHGYLLAPYLINQFFQKHIFETTGLTAATTL